MATLQDFREIFQDQVHDFAGDDRLEEMCATVEAIELLAKQEERERIINLLVYGQREPLVRAMVCTDASLHPADEIYLRKALEPK